MDKTIEFEGVTFTVPSDQNDLDVEAIEAWEDEKFTPFLRALMGLEKWNEVKRQFAARHGHNMRFKDLLKLADEIGKSYGFESVGESSGSEVSSESTAEPSPPTSKPSTDSDSRQSVNAP